MSHFLSLLAEYGYAVVFGVILLENLDTCVGNTERFFLRHGMPTLLVAKFLPGLNTIAPPLMGTLRAGLGRFLAYDTGGAVIFSVVTVGVGYFLGWEMVDRVGAAASLLGVWVGWGFGAFALAYVGWRLAHRVRVRNALRTVGLTPAELRRRQETDEKIVVLDVLDGIAATLPAEGPIVATCV